MDWVPRGIPGELRRCWQRPPLRPEPTASCPRTRAAKDNDRGDRVVSLGTLGVPTVILDHG